MHEPFFPQLALFVAGPSVIGLYREFIFPSVPRNTGLLPAALDDIGVTNQDNEPIAIDIALSRAAVIVYDEGRRSRVPIEYVRMLRGTSPVVVVTAPTPRLASTRTQRPQSGNETTIDRPAEMGGWPQSFVEPLLGHIRAVAPPSPSAELIGAELQRLTTEKSWSHLLLTGLALLERRIRDEDLPTAVPLIPTDGVMERLQAYFGPDFSAVIEAVALRHDLLQGLQLKGERLEASATAVGDLVRVRYALPDPNV